MATVSTHKLFRTLYSDISKKKFAPIYLLMGEETYYIDALCELLQNSVVPEDERDFNFSLFFGADSNIDDVCNVARQYPVMSDRRIVILKEIQSMQDAKRKIEKLLPYAEHPSASTVLVLTFKGESLSASSKFVKAVGKNGGVVFNSPRLWENQVDEAIKDYCSGKGVNIDDKSIEMLKEFIGTNLSKIFGAIDKVLITLSNGEKRISPENIERNIGINKDFNNYELVKAIATKNYFKAMQIVAYFERNPKENPTVVTSSVLFKFFSELLLAYYSKDKSPAGIAAQLRAKSQYSINVKDTIAGMPNYNAAKCVRIIHSIRDFDCKSKGIGSMQKDYSLLRELIFNIFTL